MEPERDKWQNCKTIFGYDISEREEKKRWGAYSRQKESMVPRSNKVKKKIKGDQEKKSY